MISQMVKKKYFLWCPLIAILAMAFSCRAVIAEEPLPSDQLFIVASDIKEATDNVNFILFNYRTQETNSLLRRKNTVFPTAVLSRDGKNLYTSKIHQTGDDSPDYIELFGYAMPINPRKMPELLTEPTKIWNVDYIRSSADNTKVFMRVVQAKRDNAQLAVYNVDSKKINVWNEDDSTHEIHYFDYSPASRTIIALEHSLDEETALLQHANRDQVALPPVTYRVVLYSEDGRKLREIATIKKHILDISLSPDGKQALFTVTDQINSNSFNLVFKLNLESGSYEEVFRDTDTFRRIKHAQYASDEKRIYFSAILKNAPVLSGEKRRKVPARNIAIYDPKTNQMTKVWSMEKGTVNQFQVLYP